MKIKNQKLQFKTLASENFNNAYLDFMLSRQALLCPENTLRFYEYSLMKIFTWLEEHDINSLDEINSQHIRAFLGEMAARADADSRQSGHVDRVINYSNAKTYERNKDRKCDLNGCDLKTINPRFRKVTFAIPR